MLLKIMFLMVKIQWGISIVNRRGVRGISLQSRNANKKCQQDNLLPTGRSSDAPAGGKKENDDADRNGKRAQE